jgi:hypothetical protein
MRPKPAMWSEYGAPHWTSASRRGTRTSIGPKILLAAASVIAGVIGVSGIDPQVVDAEWVQDAAGSHQPKMTPPTSATTTKRSGIVAAIPLPPRRATTTGQASVSSPRPAPAPELSQLVAAVEPPAETLTPLALATIPDAETKADALPADRVVAAPAKPGNKLADRPRVAIAKKKIVRVEHHQRGYSSYAQYGGGWGGWRGGWSGF